MTPQLIVKDRLTPAAFDRGYVEVYNDTYPGSDQLVIGKSHGAYTIKGFVDGRHVNEAERTLGAARRLVKLHGPHLIREVARK